MAKNKPIFMRYDLRMEDQSDAAEIMVYGEISSAHWDDESMTAKDFDKLIKDAKGKGARKLTLRINSPGGAVNQAVAMKTMVEGGDFDDIHIAIEGFCASAATLLCCISGAHVTIAEGSEFMIHNPSTIAWGTAKDFKALAERLDRLEDEFAGIYARRSNKDKDTCRAMMDAETWMTAQEAVDAGFCDEVLGGNEVIATCATRAMMEAMKQIYHNIPDGIAILQDSNAQTAVAAATAPVNTSKTEEKTMEIKDLTMEQLRAENPSLIQSAMQAGAQAERERIAEIDDLTPAGYEDMANEAKANGMSAMDFHKAIVKAQREKGKSFMAARREETAPAQNVVGESADDTHSDEDELKAFAKEMAGYAAEAHANDGGMY